MHRRCCRQAASSVHYRPKHVELIEIINKPLLLHVVGYLFYWQMGFNSVFKGLRRTSRNLGWDTPICRRIKHGFLLTYLPIAAIMAPSLLVSLHSACHPTFSSAARDTIPVSREFCCNHRNILASGWRRLGLRWGYSRISPSIRHVSVTGSLNLTWVIICTVSVEQT